MMTISLGAVTLLAIALPYIAIGLAYGPEAGVGAFLCTALGGVVLMIFYMTGTLVRVALGWDG